MHLIRNKYNRAVHSRDMAELLGLKGTKLPPHAMPEREIQGIRVWVIASEATFTPNAGLRRNKRAFTHRVMCACPVCGKTIPVGRLAQHSVIHEADHAA
jgi:hypothetical protein